MEETREGRYRRRKASVSDARSYCRLDHKGNSAVAHYAASISLSLSECPMIYSFFFLGLFLFSIFLFNYLIIYFLKVGEKAEGHRPKTPHKQASPINYGESRN